ncbi:MAG: hypothetical protein L0Y72_02515 [Gemmataceae bacterium]|nr:hypothetical protein [Gemmataceae bacterium]MCI0737890.1 hypothetical protein [Gemmataceae bacterium]
MRICPSRSLVPLVAGLLTAGVWLCAPPKSQASCGDYVIVGGHSTPTPQSGSRTSLQDWLEKFFPRHGQPCRGPECKSGPVSVPPLTVPKTISPIQEFAQYFALICMPQETMGQLWLFTNSIHANQRASDIFHPPRV